MDGQRSETGLNWCSADWGERYTRDRDSRCDGTDATATVITSGSHRLCPPHRCSRREETRHRCCQRTGDGGRYLPGTCPSCVSRGGGPDAGAGMAGRLSTGTTAPNWRKAKGIHHHRRMRGHLLGSRPGAFTLPQNCLAVATTWMSSRIFSGGWMVYLFCYLILINSGFPISHALEDSRQSNRKPDGAKGGIKTAEDYLLKNFPEKFNNSDDVWSNIRSSSSVNDRVRLGRSGSRKLEASAHYMRQINQESAKASCQPRDTVLDSYEELNIPKGYDTKVFPGCVVVRRCKNGGCCRDDQECEPRSDGRQNVSKLFLINTRITLRSIVEDTGCECVEKPDFCSPPETNCPHGKAWSYGQCGCACQLRCPKPFLQDEATCACDCLMNNRVCKNIQRGRKDLKLSGEECDCVKRGLCGIPNCVNGRFHMSKCKCVQQEQNRWS